ncbi:glycoside hydrolase family 127 protein [Sphingobacterium sp. SRCM116780]|uniref:glycoside hydrolase family 127 protein n=1 Tax=Sphingobacterium sp. SRCM116780 TaxID=2907623 RepID=UPI001F181527|nr:glycoside hydrolase family 127 protein [Sphingobacterium sp. SRCM116780]UIR54635.1 glycoside hydrolase family 127 protein [Sphingobacterium sp. SRCM116780]
MKNYISLVIPLLFAYPTVQAQTFLPHTQIKTTVSEKVNIQAKAYNLEEVTLYQSPFLVAQQADVKLLKWMQPDRLLAGFRTNAGLQPKADKYGGWESMGLAGHSLGHYLSALSLYYGGNKDNDILQRINYIVDELNEIQSARKTGYIGAILEEDRIWSEVAKGDIRTHSFDLNGGWAPWYTIHKIMAGLLDAHIYAKNPTALTVATKFADWADQLLTNLNEEQMQNMLKCEYGGMAEVLTNIYAFTGNEKYLKLSYRFYDKPLLDALANQEDALPGKHANTQIPKAIASARRYQLTGDKKDQDIANFFFQTVLQHHTYATGGNSNYEYFGQQDKLNNTLSDNTTETCNTYNMLKLAQQLFVINPQTSLMDYYERALYNHILASQNPNDGMVTYYTSLRMGGSKEFSDHEHSFTCCMGTGMENHVKYNESIYFKNPNGGIYVNLYIPSQLDDKSQGIQLSQQSNIPTTDFVSFSVNSTSKKVIPLYFRKPSWTTVFTISVNGKEIQPILDEKSGYYVISQKWGKNDQIQLQLGSGFHTEAMPDNPNRRAIFYGPVILAAQLGLDEPDPVEGIPVLISNSNDPKDWVQMENANYLNFKTKAKTAYPNTIALKPFNQFVNEHYTLYWDVFTADQWKVQQAKYEADKFAQRELESRTLAFFRPGEMQPERDHEFTGEHLETGEDHNRKWRIASPKGYMSFTMKVNPTDNNELMLTYWGMDNRDRTFNIEVDGKVIAQQDVNQFKESKFYDINYQIPKELTKGKSKVTIKLIPKDERNSAGPIYGARTVVSKK